MQKCDERPWDKTSIPSASLVVNLGAQSWEDEEEEHGQQALGGPQLLVLHQLVGRAASSPHAGPRVFSSLAEPIASALASTLSVFVADNASLASGSIEAGQLTAGLERAALQALLLASALRRHLRRHREVAAAGPSSSTSSTEGIALAFRKSGVVGLLPITIRGLAAALPEALPTDEVGGAKTDGSGAAYLGHGALVLPRAVAATLLDALPVPSAAANPTPGTSTAASLLPPTPPAPPAWSSPRVLSAALLRLASALTKLESRGVDVGLASMATQWRQPLCILAGCDSSSLRKVS